jgi:hypothetical protein
MRPYLVFLLPAFLAGLPPAARATTINASTTTYIASTDPYGAANDSSSQTYSDPSLVTTPQYYSATSNYDGGSAYAWGYAQQGLMGGMITSSKPTAVISLNADAQARSTFSESDIGVAHDTSGALSIGTAFLKTFNLGTSGSSSPQPPCCDDFLYVSAFLDVYDLTTGGNQIVGLDYGVGVPSGATSATVTLHEGDQLELSYGFDMANYASALESTVTTLFADYSNTFEFYVSGGDPTGTVISNTAGYDYSQIAAPNAVPEPSTLALVVGTLAVMLGVRRRSLPPSYYLAVKARVSRTAGPSVAWPRGDCQIMTAARAAPLAAQFTLQINKPHVPRLAALQQPMLDHSSVPAPNTDRRYHVPAAQILKAEGIARRSGRGLAGPVHLYDASAMGSISDGSLFLTLPTRALTGQQIMSSPE